MKFTKSRVFGAIVLILAALLIFTGVSGRVADRAGAPLAAAYAQSQEHRQEAERLSATVAAAQEALDRADKRASDALSEAQDCATQAANAPGRPRRTATTTPKPTWARWVRPFWTRSRPART